MTNDLFTQTDLEQMEKLGISEDEAKRQLAILEKGQRWTVLERPCTTGDGIAVLASEDQERFVSRWQEAAEKGRLSAFLPASGAATRMFAFLERIRNQVERVTLDETADKFGQASDDYQEFRVFVESLEEFAFFEPLAEVMGKAGTSLQEKLQAGVYNDILDFLLEPRGLHYSTRPKALIPFHRYADHYRTALEEHLVESTHTVRDQKQRCRVHFTLAPENRAEAEAYGREAAAKYGERLGVQYELSFSIQSPATNTLAVDLDNKPFRKVDGNLLFRPGGHGALLENLNQLEGDIVLIKNIDNVVTDERRDLVVRHQRILAGMLLELQHEIFNYLRLLQSGSLEVNDLQKVLDFVVYRLNPSMEEQLFSCGDEEKVARLFRLLNRPLRVCGMVVNRGEPGGGPFWVKDASGGLSLQVVEQAEIDRDSPEQVAILEGSTHFSPVQIVCGLRDFKGRPFNLTQFVDPAAVFISRKTEDGRELKALELPGLWNGGMAYWNTMFVEIPEETFNPVKTINDLLRPGHRAGPSGQLAAGSGQEKSLGTKH
jgi:hypothetical protein